MAARKALLLVLNEHRERKSFEESENHASQIRPSSEPSKFEPVIGFTT